MDQNISIKPLEERQIPDLLHLASIFEGESAFVKVDPGTFEQTLLSLIKSDLGVVYCAVSSGHVVGSIGGMIVTCPLSGLKKMMELFWFVDPMHRKGNIGIKLLSTFEIKAFESGCDSIMMVHMADSMPGKIKRLYVGRGYVEIETTYSKELKPWELQPRQ
jgi:hypothetical protein